MKLLGEKMVVVTTKKDDSHMVFTEDTVERYRNNGVVIGVTDDISRIKTGDIVHFADMSGVYYGKEKNIILLSESEILFISDSDKIHAGELLSFEITEGIDPSDNVCVI